MKPSEHIPALTWSIPVAAVGLIADEEQGPGGGIALKAYRCPAGVWTIGLGETDGVKAGQVCTEAQAWEMLRADIEKRAASVRAACTRDPGPNELGAMVSLHYNIGGAAFASAYAVLGDVRVVVLTQPDRSNTLMALPGEIERLQGERSSQ